MKEKIIKFLDKSWLGRKILKLKVKLEGRDAYSKTIRIQYKEKKVEVGMYSYGGCFSNTFNNGGDVTIGNYCSLASFITYLGGNHPMHYASMSPFFYNKNFGKFEVKDIKRGKLNIGHDVWIGQNVLITNKCCEIGNGAIIGAGSVVTKNIPPYSICVGSPAKIIKYRFDDKTIQLLEESRWWELEPINVMQYYSFIDQPKLFAQKIIEDRNKIRSSKKYD